MEPRALASFLTFARQPDDDLPLGVGALHVAAVEHPGLDHARELARLDALAGRSGAGTVSRPRARLERLCHFLFAEEGFRGNAADYYDARNSCLNDVLDRHLGIPVTLSVLTIEVGRRVGLCIAGVSLPGHFIVAVDLDGERVLVDPFGGGRLVSAAEAAELAARAQGRPVQLRADHLSAVGSRRILARMLTNLRGIYVRCGNWERSLAVVERLIVLEGARAGHVRDRGSIHARLDRLGPAAADLARYLTLAPDAPDAAAVRRQLERTRRRLAALN